MGLGSKPGQIGNPTDSRAIEVPYLREFMDVEVWIDDSGVVRKMQYDLGSVNGLHPVVEAEYYDFGVPVPPVVAPPESDTFAVTA